LGLPKWVADLREAEAMGYFQRSVFLRPRRYWPLRDYFNGGPRPTVCAKPDMLVCCNNICGDPFSNGMKFDGAYFNVPLFILDTPICHTGVLRRRSAKYVRQVSLDEVSSLFVESACQKKIQL